MANADDTTSATPSKPQELLEQHIEGERTRLLQGHAVLICLREALLYAEDDDTVIHAAAAKTAAELVNRAVERLDAVNLQPGIRALRRDRNYEPLPERGLSFGTDDDDGVKECSVRHLR